ncbi:hypothetical protein ACFL08_01550, partial [Patescibacteria group bacterium]
TLVIVIIASLLIWKNQCDEKVGRELIGVETKDVSEDVSQKETINDIAEEVEEYIVPGVDTSDWKVYENEKYGIKFKIPSEWYVEDDGSGRLCLKSSIEKFYFEGEKDVCGVGLALGKFTEDDFVKVVRERQERLNMLDFHYVNIANTKGLYSVQATRRIVFKLGNNIVDIAEEGTNDIPGSKYVSSAFFGVMQTLQPVE